MKRVLTHIALQVKDVQRSANFYRDWCGMEVVHSRSIGGGQPVVWMASPGEEDLFVVVLAPGRKNEKAANGFEHLGFALDSREELKALCEKARAAGLLQWDYEENPYPVGDLFSIRDPDGNQIEFSFGQPLGRDFKKHEGPQP